MREKAMRTLWHGREGVRTAEECVDWDVDWDDVPVLVFKRRSVIRAGVAIESIPAVYYNG